MPMKPATPHPHKKRVRRIAPAPVVIVQKKKSGAGGMILLLLLLVLGGGAGLIHYNKQKNEAALAAQQERQEENAKVMAENERMRAERDQGKQQSREAAKDKVKESKNAKLDEYGYPEYDEEEEYVMEEEDASHDYGSDDSMTALGSRVKPKAGTGSYAETGGGAVFNLSATDSEAEEVMDSLLKAMKKAAKEGTCYDLQADLMASFAESHPKLFRKAGTLPAMPDKEDKLLFTAQAVCVCLDLASQIESEGNVKPEKHTAFLAWLLDDKGKAARGFAYGLDHYEVTSTKEATKKMLKLREAYLKSPSKALKKIKTITKK